MTTHLPPPRSPASPSPASSPPALPLRSLHPPSPLLLARLRLARAKGVGARTAALLEERCGPPLTLFGLSEDELLAREVPPRLVRALLDPAARAQAEAELRAHRGYGHDLIALGEEAYPEALATILDPPQVLSLRGALDPDALRVAVVGARRATPEGLEVAYELALGLAAAGVTVVSGLARGVDTAAHRGALAAGGRTLAVLGSGLQRVYPLRNLELAERIAAQGALISEFAPETEPRRHTFPQRNRIVTGLAEAVVVVQAGPRSGALLSADFALQQGRELCAVPGSVREPLAQGTNDLLREGAHLVTCAQDVLDLVQGVESAGLEPQAARVLRALAEGCPPGQLGPRLGLACEAAHQALGALELEGLVRPSLSGPLVTPAGQRELAARPWDED